jgi:hypothetical protein
MFYAAFVLWLWRGGDRMSIQPTDPAAIPDVATFPARTIHDVEHEMHLANSLIVERRARQNQKTAHYERLDGKPGILTQEVNWLLEEWRVMWDAARD